MNTDGKLRYSHTVGCYALRGIGFLNPVDVALGRGEVLYVISRGHMEVEDRMAQKRVTICNVAGEYLGEFSTGGTGDGELMWPVSIAIDKEENIYISDEALHRITVLDKEGRFLHKWGVNGQKAGEFDRPSGIVFDEEDNLLVVDGMNCRIQMYSKDGRYMGEWGRPGTGEGEFNVPWGIATDRAGNVYVADWRNDRIQKFGGGGGYLESWGSPGGGQGQFHRPSGVAVDSYGHIYVADWGNERLQVLGPDGEFLAKFRGESGWSKWAQDWFNTSNKDLLEEWQNANLEPDLDPLQSDFLRYESGSTVKLFWGPTSVKTDSQGRVYVVESCRHRIQVYHWVSYPEVPLPGAQARIHSITCFSASLPVTLGDMMGSLMPALR